MRSRIPGLTGRKRMGMQPGLRRDTSGLTLLFWAFAFLGIFAFLVIVADSGLIYLQRRQLQNTADAAALAGAQKLFVDQSLAVSEAQLIADENTSDLLTNVAVAGGGQVQVNVSKNASSLLPPDSELSFGAPEVHATATARLAGARLPGIGVFCVAVELLEHFEAVSAQDVADILTLNWADLDPFITILRTGGGSSNAGFIDISGSVNENTRDCLRDGSVNPLTPTEETQTGISTGQAAQALQERLEAARDRNCFTWQEIVDSIAAADSDRDGIADDGSWRCNPISDQASSVVLMPIVNEDFQDNQGTIPVHVHDQGTPRPYLLAMFWIDADRTFENTNVANWKFASDGQGHAEIAGVFLADAPVTLGAPPQGSADFVLCDPAEFISCFVQLID